MQVPSLGQEDSPGGGHGYPLQYSFLENPMDRGVRRAAVHGVAESDTTERPTLWYLMESKMVPSSQALKTV